jgi:hypothetical protein
MPNDGKAKKHHPDFICSDGRVFSFRRRSGVYEPNSERTKKNNDHRDGAAYSRDHVPIEIRRDGFAFWMTTFISVATLFLIAFYTFYAALQAHISASGNYNFMKAQRENQREFQVTLVNNQGQFQNTLKQMTAQTTAQEKATSVGRESLQVSERAYLITGAPTMNEGVVSFPVSNVGHIPSGKVRIEIHESTILLPDAGKSVEIVPATESHWKHFDVDSMPATSSSTYNAATESPSYNAKLFNAGTQQTVLVGTIFFRDGFPDTPSREWHFCYHSFSTSKGNAASWTPCDWELYIKEVKAVDGYPKNETE